MKRQIIFPMNEKLAQKNYQVSSPVLRKSTLQQTLWRKKLSNGNIPMNNCHQKTFNIKY